MSTVAATERALLADALAEVGPGAATLCAGWTARDLVAHLVLRDRRPVAAVGMVVGVLAGHNRSVHANLARRPFEDLVATFRRRPPLLPSALDDLFNAVEFFVHLQDVRRAQPSWQPTEPDPHLEATTWRSLRTVGPHLLRRVTVGVVLVRPDGARLVPRKGEPTVTLTGAATELTLYLYGRTGHARVEVTGDPATLAAFTATGLAR
jgi:uncharacterized protein (TIGR03085 family)